MIKIISIFLIAVFIFSGCSKKPVASSFTNVNAQEEVVKYNKALEDKKSSPSLWANVGSSGTLFLDYKGRTLGDIIIVKIVESSSATNSNSTKTSRASSYSSGITNLLGLPLNMGMTNFLNQGKAFDPKVESDSSNTFNGSGSKQKSDRVQATIAARIVDILPSGNLVIEGNREIVVDQEKQSITVHGIIRQKDIDADNTVLSTAIADAQISYSGNGVITDANKKGWLSNLLEWIWPL